MKIHTLSFFILTCLMTLNLHAAAPSAADEAASALVARVLPEHAQFFVVDTSLPAQAEKDVFAVSDTKEGKILLQGNNGVSVASALNWYLKNRANCHLSWCGDQLNLPSLLPKVGEKIIITNLHKHRVYFNYCTLSYSAAFWQWDRWQREIDFMAMNGINTPLSVVGLEAVWYHTLLKHGFTDLEARTYLCGPSFFAWQWMTNIQSHGGPLPKSWIDSHIILGKQILDSQRALGMTPIQQGFSGCVPRLMMKKFPEASIKQGPDWCNFEGTAQLDPLDPLFEEIGATFLSEQERLFGTSHLYGCDPFHEGAPPVKGDDYLVKVGKKIYQLLDHHDPKSTWVMQSWSIRKPIATAAPKDRLLVVDLGGAKHTSVRDKDGAFWGYPFVSGRLHNFGSRINMHGDLRKLATNPFAGIHKGYPNSAGMGLFMEGIIQNPAYYDMAFDMIWRDGGVNPNEALHSYAERRYGAKSDNANKAWDILLATAYKPGTDGVEQSSIICARPAINVKKSGPNAGLGNPYNYDTLHQAWRLLLQDAEKLKASEAYRYDVVDLGRQVLSNYGQTLQHGIKNAYNAKDAKAFEIATARFHELLKDVDTLLATRPEFSFDQWVTDARSHGTTPEEKNLYELNARCLVTLWGPLDRTPTIFDYSWREWSGLIDSYYLPRWEKFHAHVLGLMKAGKTYQEDGLPQAHGREAFLANDFYRELAKWETAWVKTPAKVNPGVRGDEIELALAMDKKYTAQIAQIVQEKTVLKQNTLDKVAAETKDLGKKIATWVTDGVTTSYKTYTVPLTEVIDGEGEYTVTFLYASGNARLSIQSAELLANDKPLSTDKHQGMTGNEHVNNTYNLKLDQHAFGTKYTLRYTAKSDGSTDSNGVVFLKKK